MKLSIILPVYNMEKYLDRSLKSLLQQDLPEEDYEIIIVNDESKDNSLKIANEYASKYPNIKVVDKKNGGTGAARNSGLDVASGEYVHFVDPDDYVARNVYKTLLDYSDNKQIDILTIEIIETKQVDLYDSKTDMESIDLDGLPVIDGIEYLAKNNYNNACWWYIINRSFLDKTGYRFIEGRWMEDSIITPELFLKAKRVAEMPMDVYRYMINPNSARTSKDQTHYHKFIYDIESATYVFDDIIKGIDDESVNSKACKQRIKTRQQSFVFFMLYRFMKSNLPMKKLPGMLDGLKKINAYPLTIFPGKDFNHMSHKLLTYVFNRESVMYLFMRTFRLVYAPIIRLRSM